MLGGEPIGKFGNQSIVSAQQIGIFAFQLHLQTLGCRDYRTPIQKCQVFVGPGECGVDLLYLGQHTHIRRKERLLSQNVLLMNQLTCHGQIFIDPLLQCIFPQRLPCRFACNTQIHRNLQQFISITHRTPCQQPPPRAFIRNLIHGLGTNRHGMRSLPPRGGFGEVDLSLGFEPRDETRVGIEFGVALAAVFSEEAFHFHFFFEFAGGGAASGVHEGFGPFFVASFSSGHGEGLLLDSWLLVRCKGECRWCAHHL
mmetsp:Transcript_27846/g.50355  ORF Transcript_27846/g.50355 Transcript_27846/m.50355 type:complete len:255 (-) Transcript_27846:190-954(-)